LLGAADRVIRNQKDALDVALGDRKNKPANTARCKRIRCDPTSRRIMEEILAEEEEHADDMKTLLETVAKAA